MNDFEGLLASDSASNPKENRLQWLVPNPPPPSEDHQCVLAPPPIPSKIAILSSPSPTHSRNPKIFGFEFGDLFSSARYAPKLNTTTTTSSSFNIDMFCDFDALAKSSSSLSMPPPPVYDKPVYDDDIFYGVLGLKSSAANVKYEDVFTLVVTSLPPKGSGSGIGSGSDVFEDLLRGFGNVDCSYNLSPKELCTKIVIKTQIFHLLSLLTLDISSCVFLQPSEADTFS